MLGKLGRRVAQDEADVVAEPTVGQGAAARIARRVVAALVHDQPVEEDAVPRLQLPRDDVVVPARGLDVRAALEHHAGMAGAVQHAVEGREPAPPSVGAAHELQRRLRRDGIERDPVGAELLAVHRHVWLILMPLREAFGAGLLHEHLVVEERDGGRAREGTGDLGARPLQGERLHLRHVAPKIEVVKEEAGVGFLGIDFDMGAGFRHVGGDAFAQSLDPVPVDHAAQAHHAVIAIGLDFGLRRHHGVPLPPRARVYRSPRRAGHAPSPPATIRLEMRRPGTHL